MTVLLRPEISAMDMLCEHNKAIKAIVDCLLHLQLTLMTLETMKDWKHRLTLIAEYSKTALAHLERIDPDGVREFKLGIADVLDAARAAQKRTGDDASGGDKTQP